MLREIMLLVLVSLVCALGMCVSAYLTLRGFGGLSELEQNLLAERILLLGVVETVAEFGGLSMVLYDAVNVNAVHTLCAGEPKTPRPVTANRYNLRNPENVVILLSWPIRFG